MRSNRFRPLFLVILLVVTACWKIWILLQDAVPFNGDEAIVGLMARHILLEGERPAFFYGQAYMGSLDAYLVTAGFALFGMQIWVIRLVQVVLYLAVLATTVWIGERFLGAWQAGMVAAILLAIPPVNMTLYTTASLGGYGEALLIGNLILLSGLAWLRQIQAVHWKRGCLFALLFGFFVGLGLWANGLTLVYSIPMSVAVLWVLVKQKTKFLMAFAAILAALPGFFVGSLPWWLHAYQQGFASLMAELLGNNVAVETGSWLARSGQHLFNLFVLGGTAGLGFRPPWEVRWLVLPLLPLILVFWTAVPFWFVKFTRKNTYRLERLILVGILLVFCAAFLFTSFGVDPSGRYFLPSFWVYTLLAGSVAVDLKVNLRWKIAAIALVVIFQAWGTLNCVQRNPPGLTTQFYQPTVYDHSTYPQLIDFLEEHGETRGYSTYWVSYPLAFRSQESLIFTPALPYHTDLSYAERDNRYAPYTRLVEQSQQVAYITARNNELDAYLREAFTQLGVRWKEQSIGDFRVFYDLSTAVRPQEMGLGSVRSQ
jgi:4-amino-4-deoxy-L-arabinose transferase-like glycosyltransferase